MEENLKIYEAVRSVPETALRSITGGRLKGKSDINPMWRIKTLTEQFGAVGFGWYYEIVDKRLEYNNITNEIAAFVDIKLFVKVGEEWSKPIIGTGGSMYVVREKSGPYANDECFKMALTDAISVSCKAIGIGADVYWDKDKTKYSEVESERQVQTQAKTLLNLTNMDSGFYEWIKNEQLRIEQSGYQFDLSEFIRFYYEASNDQIEFIKHKIYG